MFIHWGPYSEHARGEQVLFREHLDQRGYAGRARQRNPRCFHARESARVAGESAEFGDFGTPEQRITTDPNSMWESCQTSTWRLWGYAKGEHWRPAELLLDFLCESASKDGNLLLNVGLTGDGVIPTEFVERSRAIGDWLKVHGEAIHSTQRGDVTEFATRGWQTRRGNVLHLIYRFWHGRDRERIAELATPVRRATLLSTGQELTVRHAEDAIYLDGLPASKPCKLFPVIRLECDGEPRPKPWVVDRLWAGDPARMRPWVLGTRWRSGGRVVPLAVSGALARAVRRT